MLNQKPDWPPSKKNLWTLQTIANRSLAPYRGRIVEVVLFHQPQ